MYADLLCGQDLPIGGPVWSSGQTRRGRRVLSVHWEEASQDVWSTPERRLATGECTWILDRRPVRQRRPRSRPLARAERAVGRKTGAADPRWRSGSPSFSATTVTHGDQLPEGSPDD